MSLMLSTKVKEGRRSKGGARRFLRLLMVLMPMPPLQQQPGGGEGSVLRFLVLGGGRGEERRG